MVLDGTIPLKIGGVWSRLPGDFDLSVAGALSFGGGAVGHSAGFVVGGTTATTVVVGAATTAIPATTTATAVVSISHSALAEATCGGATACVWIVKPSGLATGSLRTPCGTDTVIGAATISGETAAIGSRIITTRSSATGCDDHAIIERGTTDTQITGAPTSTSSGSSIRATDISCRATAIESTSQIAVLTRTWATGALPTHIHIHSSAGCYSNISFGISTKSAQYGTVGATLCSPKFDRKLGHPQWYSKCLYTACITKGLGTRVDDAIAVDTNLSTGTNLATRTAVIVVGF